MRKFGGFYEGPGWFYGDFRGRLYMVCYDEILGLGMAICLNVSFFFEDLLAICKTPLEEILWDRYHPTCIGWFNIGICRQEWELKFEMGMK